MIAQRWMRWWRGLWGTSQAADFLGQRAHHAALRAGFFVTMPRIARLFCAPRLFTALCGALVALAASGAAQCALAQGVEEAVELTAAQLFAFADAARDAGDLATAEAAYRALARNPSLELRNEARFRLALMIESDDRRREAAVLLREMLDEQPSQARVRVELARMQAAMGNMREAGRELRAAQAIGLPPEVERLVNVYVDALSAQRPFGVSLEVAFAPDSNVNRATRSDTLGTVIGDFELDEDAQAQSGVGLSASTGVWGRLPLSAKTSLLAQVRANGQFYRDSQFDDYALGLEVGPQWRWGSDRLALSASTSDWVSDAPRLSVRPYYQ